MRVAWKKDSFFLATFPKSSLLLLLSLWLSLLTPTPCKKMWQSKQANFWHYDNRCKRAAVVKMNHRPKVQRGRGVRQGSAVGQDSAFLGGIIFVPCTHSNTFGMSKSGKIVSKLTGNEFSWLLFSQLCSWFLFLFCASSMFHIEESWLELLITNWWTLDPFWAKLAILNPHGSHFVFLRC